MEKDEAALPMHDIDINSKQTIAAAIIFGTIGVLSFIVQPGLVQGFVVELKLSEVAANDLAFYEMVGIAISTVGAAFLNRKLNWRTIMFASLVMACAGNGWSAISAQDSLSPARFLTGLGEGGVISLSFAVIGLTAKTERNLALYLVLLLSYGAVGLWGMPAALETIGLNGVFLFWTALTAASFYLIQFLPTSSEGRAEPSPTAAQISAFMLGVALLGVLLYNTAIGIAWANLFLIGMEIRPDDQAIANALLLSQFVAIAGALIPIFMERRLGRWAPIIIGVFGGAASIALLLFNPGYLIFTASVCGFNFLWNFVLPFILSSIADMETRSEIMSRAIAMQMIGLSLGPFFAARILGEGAGFKTIEQATIALLIVSFFLLAIAKIARRQALNRSQET